MLREAWRKWRVNFLGSGWGVEEDIFGGFWGVFWLIDEMYRGGMGWGYTSWRRERDGYKVVRYRLRGTYLTFSNSINVRGECICRLVIR